MMESSRRRIIYGVGIHGVCHYGISEPTQRSTCLRVKETPERGSIESAALKVQLLRR